MTIDEKNTINTKITKNYKKYLLVFLTTFGYNPKLKRVNQNAR